MPRAAAVKLPPVPATPLGKTLMMFVPKGGTGKTTIAAHLLVSAAKAGRTVLGVDFDPQGTLVRWSKERRATVKDTTRGKR